MTVLRAAILALLIVAPPARGEPEPPNACRAPGLHVQVLGAGGGDLTGGRAAASYLVWIDGKARVLIDFGPGNAMRFGQSGARAAGLDAVLFTHLRTGRTLDFPALISTALREARARPLPVYGPRGNRFAPSTVTFVRTLFDGTRGAYRHLGAVLNPLAKGGFKLQPHDARPRRGRIGVGRDDNDVFEVYTNERMNIAAAYVAFGNVPALAWRIRAQDRSIVFSGDTNGKGERLERLLRGADLFIAHHAVAEPAQSGARDDHMPPSVIGRIAAGSQVKRLVLSHRTRLTLGRETESTARIRAYYRGPVVFADDLDCFALKTDATATSYDAAR